MVNVGVTEHDSIDLLRIKGKITVAFDGFIALALIEAAFQQEPSSINLEKVHRAGGGPSGAEKMDLHGAKDGATTNKVESGVTRGK